MKSLAGRVKRLQEQFVGTRGNCRVCGEPLGENPLWKGPLKLKAIFQGDPEPLQCPACGRPPILRITFD